jgi:glycerophosphoryl diester phosphodiesterase
MLSLLQNAAMAVADAVYSLLPSPLPSRRALQACKLVSHRGEHDNRRVIENTLPAFRQARDAGVWGLEADIRWSQDLVPLVTHDPDGLRLFGDAGIFAQMDFARIRQRMPLVPSLEELLDEFGGNMHLMLEIKQEHYPQPARQRDILRQMLAALEPGADYHFLALDTQLFQHVDFVERCFCFPVAELNVAKLSAASLEAGYGGLTGHFLLLGKALQQRHEAVGQRIGTGFISSRNCLYRELNRDIEWVFSNDAVRMQACLDAALKHGSP